MIDASDSWRRHEPMPAHEQPTADSPGGAMGDAHAGAGNQLRHLLENTGETTPADELHRSTRRRPGVAWVRPSTLASDLGGRLTARAMKRIHTRSTTAHTAAPDRMAPVADHTRDRVHRVKERTRRLAPLSAFGSRGRSDDQISQNGVGR